LSKTILQYTMMITRTLNQIGNSLILSLFLLIASSTLVKAQTINYACNCEEDNPAGLISFVINTWGCAPGDVITIVNPVNLLDAAGNPLNSGDTFTFNPSAGTLNTFTLEGLSDPAGPIPTLSILKNGAMHFPDYEMFSCREPQFPITPANPSVCTGGLVKLTVVDGNGAAPTSTVTWTAMGSATQTISGTNDNCIELSYVVPGTYTVTVTGTSQDDACDYEFTTTVTVTDAGAGASLDGPMEIFVCAGDMDKEYELNDFSGGIDVTYKLTNTDDGTTYGPFGPYGTSTGTGGTGSGTGSGSTTTPPPGGGTVSFPAIAGNYEITVCNADVSANACLVSGITKSVVILDGPPAITLPADITLDHLCVGENYQYSCQKLALL